MNRLFVFLAAIALFTTIASESIAYRNTPSGSYYSFSSASQRVCDVVADKIHNGKDIRAVIQTSIQMGFHSCPVIKCALAEGGNLEDVIRGAIEAGITPDVVSRCCLDAGAEPREIVRYLVSAGASGLCYIQPGLGYLEPDVNPNPPPPVPPPPPPPISPYRFY